MTSERFDRAFRILMFLEDVKLTDNATDPGGLTKFGISQKAHPNLAIANLTESDAREIYSNEYWTPVHGEELPENLAIAVFCQGVNQGIGTATKNLQKALRVEVDGRIGPKTLAKAESMEEHYLIRLFLSESALSYIGLRGFEENGLGWMNRLFKIQYKILMAE